MIYYLYKIGGVKMKNKGFTLIELLAVIIILAIIALISMPLVLNTIEKARDWMDELKRKKEEYKKSKEGE